MSRRKTDPRVIFVLATLERAIVHRFRDRSTVSLAVAGLAGLMEPGELTTETVVERFEAWTDDAVRELVLTIALHCPEHELDAMVVRARAELDELDAHARDMIRDAFRRRSRAPIGTVVS